VRSMVEGAPAYAPVIAPAPLSSPPATPSPVNGGRTPCLLPLALDDFRDEPLGRVAQGQRNHDTEDEDAHLQRP